MGTVALTSPQDGATGFGTYNEQNENVSCSFTYNIGDSDEPWGVGDVSQTELWIDGGWIKNMLGWKASGSYATGRILQPLTTYTVKIGAIVRTGEGGEWTRIFSNENSFTTAGPPVNVRSVFQDSVGVTIVAAAETGIFISFDSGDNWAKKLPDGVAETDWEKVICSYSGVNIIAVSSANAIYRSANGGTGWAAITPAGGDTFTVNKIAMSDDGKYVAIVGQNSTDATESCYVSTNYGVSWTAKNPINIEIIWTDCAISNDGTTIAVSASGFLEMSFDSGTTWQGQTVAATAENWGCLSISGDGSRGLVTNLSDNNEFFIGVKTASYSEETWAEADLTSAGRALLDDANAAAQATTLGLGTGDAVTHDTLTLSSIASEGTDVDKFLVDSTGVVKYRTGAEVLSDIGASASAHLHDTQTLEHDGVNSDGGAFAFTTTGIVTFNQIVAGQTPTAPAHFATKGYVDLFFGAFKSFFLSDTGSGVGSLNYAYPRETGEEESTVANDGLGEEYGVGSHLHQGFITEAGEPATTTLHEGTIEIHLHAKKGASNHRITTLHAVISRVDADGASNKLTVATSEVTSELTDTETEYTIHASFSGDIEVVATARLICDIYANVTTGALDSVVTMYMEAEHDCYFTSKVDPGIWQNHGDILDDLNTLGVPVSDGQFIVATGAGAFAYESGATARISIGLGNVNNVATDDTTYNATSWNANTDAATKNAIRDKVETMDTAIGSNTTHRGLSSGNPHSVTPTELSLVIGTNTQAWDTGLDSLAALGYVSDSMIKITAEDTYAIRTLAEVLSDIGAAASGHNHAATYQPLDAELTSLAALSYVAASFVKMTGANTFALRTIGETADDLEGTIDHDSTANYVANKHIDHTGVTLTAGKGLSGGGDISANRSFALALAEMTGNVTWDDGTTDASITWTFALSGANDPVWTIGSNSMDLTTGVLKVGGTNVLVVGDSATAHALLDGSVHTDSLADAVTRGSIIYGNTTPKWDELVIGTGFLRGDGTDCAWLSYANSLAAMSGQAGAAFSFNDQNITNVGSIAVDSIISDGAAAALTITATAGQAVTVEDVSFDGGVVSGMGTLGCDAITSTATGIFEGASVTVGKASDTTGTLVLHDSNSANTITLTVPDISAGSLSFTLPPTDGDNTNVLQTDGNGVLTWVAAGGGAGTFVALTDTPANYAGSGGKFAVVNGGENALDFTTLTGTGGFLSRCSVSLGSDQTIATATWTKVELDTEAYDDGAEFDSAVDYDFTATDAGYYDIKASAGTTDWVVASKSFQVAIAVNGTRVVFGKEDCHVQLTQRDCIAKDLYLAASDIVTLMVYQDTGGNIDIQGHIGVTYMTIHRFAGTDGVNDKVGIDSGATAGYLGAASNDGVLRTSAPLIYTDGGDFVTLSVDAGLTNLATIAMAADKYYYTSGDNVHVAGTITAAGRAILDDANAAAQATTLGLGTGDSPQFTGIELGHANDTTITRASAGNLNIEGNLVYRAGGTDVPIGDGGTGQGTAQAAINALSAVGAATNEHVLTKDTGTGNAIWKVAAAGGSGYLGYIKLSEVQAQNTDGGTFTKDVWRTRVLNTEDTDTNNDCTLNANQITLVAGTYECTISCPSFEVAYNQTRLYNTTGAAVVLLGTSEFSSSGAQTRSFIIGRFIIAASQALEVQHICHTTAADMGFGVATDRTSEVYTIAEFRRVS